MTVRQVYYQLVSRQVENTRSRYQAVSDVLVAARREGSSPGSGSTIGCVFCAVVVMGGRASSSISPTNSTGSCMATQQPSGLHRGQHSKHGVTKTRPPAY